MELPHLWKDRPSVGSVPPSSLKTQSQIDLGFELSPAIQQLVDRRGDVSVAPITEMIGIGASTWSENYAPAVDRLKQAIENHEHICVYMDFDCDGQTAGSCMVHTLQQLTSNVSYIVPSRLTDGHGLISDLVFKNEPNPCLVITVDTGITSKDAVAELKEKGYDVIITDHHLQEGDLPDCPVVDPKLFCKENDDEYMAPGVYVSAKTALLTAKYFLNEEDWHACWSYCCCLTALGIVSDVIELHPLMRAQLQVGLVELMGTPHEGILALLAMSNYRANRPITATYLSYNVIPKINAAGRMGQSEVGVQLLLLDKDVSVAKTQSALIANSLKGINDTRKIIEQAIYDQAIVQAEAYMTSHKTSLVLCDPSWHTGVIGVVAARISERYGRSTLVMSKMGDILTASGRTVNGRDLFGEVSECSDLLEGFGGHKAACGCQLQEDNFTAFCDKFEEVCTRRGENLQLEYLIDADVAIQDLYDPIFQQWTEMIAPYGNLNPELIFKLSAVEVFLIDDKKNATNFVVKNQAEESIILSKFRCPDEWKEFANTVVDVLITPSFTYFTGTTTVEWKIIDIRPIGDNYGTSEN